MSSSKNNTGLTFIQELRKDRKDSNEYKEVIIKRVLDQVIKTIKVFNSMGRTSYTFVCPYSIIGLPAYNVQEITLDINSRLKKYGLTTTFKRPNIVFIEWTSRSKTKDNLTGSFIQELHQERVSSNEYKEVIITRLFNQVIKTIKVFNSMGKTKYVFNCPSSIIGLPAYDTTEITIEISKRLKKDGMKTIIKNGSTICIDWK